MTADNVFQLPVPESPIGIRITWASDLREREGPNDDIVEGCIPKRVATLFAGPAGYGKTYLSQMLQTATAIEQPWAGLKVRRCRSLGLYTEDPGEKLAERQAKICRYYGIDREELTEWVSVMPNDDGDFFLFSGGYTRFREGHSRPLWDQVEQRIQEDGIELLILDNVRNVFQGDSNCEIHVNSFMRFLNNAARRLGVAVVLVVNPPKDQSKGYFSGSQKWEDGARNTLSLGAATNEHDGRFILKVRKSNYLPYNHPLKRKGVTLEWQDDMLTSVDDGEPVALGQLGRLDLDRRIVAAVKHAVSTLGHKFAADPMSPAYLPGRLTIQKQWQHIAYSDLVASVERLLSDGKLIKVAVAERWLIRAAESDPYLGEGQ